MLYKNLDEVYEHCPDDLVDVINMIKSEDEYCFGEEDEWSFKILTDYYALMTNFLNKKFNKEKIIEKLSDERKYSYYRSHSYNVKYFTKSLPKEYIPEKHLDVINSALHVLHKKYPSIREESITKAIDFMDMSEICKSYNLNEYVNLEYDGLDLCGHDGVPEWINSDIEKTLSIYEDICYSTNVSWSCCHSDFEDPLDYYKYRYPEFVVVDIYALNKESLELAKEALEKMREKQPKELTVEDRYLKEGFINTDKEISSKINEIKKQREIIEEQRAQIREEKYSIFKKNNENMEL